MEPIVNLVRQSQRWPDHIMRPGSVGSVGDVNPTAKLKTSCIDLPRRQDATFAGDFALPLGSVVQNGSEPDFLTNGLGARTIDSNWDIARNVLPLQQGWRIQSLQNPDMLVEPIMGSLGDFTWRNKISRTFGKTTGFETPPGEYSTSGIPRGGQIPRIVDYNVGDAYSLQLGRQSFLPKTPDTTYTFGFDAPLEVKK